LMSGDERFPVRFVGASLADARRNVWPGSPTCPPKPWQRRDPVRL
jgi:hypothetical protein